MLIACQAWEGMYQGLHGIEDLAVLTVKDEADASIELACWGREASDELIYSYGLEDSYMSDDEDDFEEEEYNITDSFYYCDCGWRGYIIKEGAFSSACEADDALCNLGFDLFVEQYCTKEIDNV